MRAEPPRDEEALEPQEDVPREFVGHFGCLAFSLNAACLSLLAYVWLSLDRESAWFWTIWGGGFEGIALFLLGKWVHLYRRRALPQVQTTVTPRTLRAGQPAVFGWVLRGNTELVTCLSVRLDGRITVQYENDGTFTHKQKFANVPLVFTEDPACIAAGQVEVQVPPDTWPSYETAQGALIWTLRFEGTAPRHVKLREEFIIHVEAKDKAWVPPPPLLALLSGDVQHAASVAAEPKRRNWQPRFMG